MPLTEVEIRSAKATDKPLKLFDGGGLFLLVNPNGSRGLTQRVPDGMRCCSRSKREIEAALMGCSWWLTQMRELHASFGRIAAVADACHLLGVGEYRGVTRSCGSGRCASLSRLRR